MDIRTNLVFFGKDSKVTLGKKLLLNDTVVASHYSFELRSESDGKAPTIFGALVFNSPEYMPDIMFKLCQIMAENSICVVQQGLKPPLTMIEPHSFVRDEVWVLEQQLENKTEVVSLGIRNESSQTTRIREKLQAESER